MRTIDPKRERDRAQDKPKSPPNRPPSEPLPPPHVPKGGPESEKGKVDIENEGPGPGGPTN